jgi:hypothetical protein
MLDNILLVNDAIVEKLVRRFSHVVLLSELNQLLALNVSKVNTVGREELLEQMNDEGYRAPLTYIGSLEGDELRCLI